MSRTDLFERRVEDLRTEARKLIDWCFKNAKFYKKHGAGLEADIRAFEDCAAALDAFQSGLAVVPPHRALHMELVRWVRVTQALPDDEETVLIVPSGETEAFIGYLCAGVWYYDSTSEVSGGVLYWAKFPAGPQMHDALAEEAAA